MTQDNSRSEPSGASSRWSIALVLFLAIAAFYLITEHWAHTLYVLPWLLLLACPLLHFWHHGGHGRASHQQEIQPPRERNRDAHQH